MNAAACAKQHCAGGNRHAVIARTCADKGHASRFVTCFGAGEILDRCPAFAHQEFGDGVDAAHCLECAKSHALGFILNPDVMRSNLMNGERRGLIGRAGLQHCERFGGVECDIDLFHDHILSKRLAQ